jgi:two-component system, chemotaxis family, sensor kinase CheA
MADTSTDQSTGDVGIDLSQFYQVFFEEASENLQNMEQLLLELDVTQADDEQLNSIFRCAHSIKGGAATFGFSDVAQLTHQMETLLDKLRRHELMPNADMVDVLLASGDSLKDMLARHQGSGADPVDTSELLIKISAHVNGEVVAVATPMAPIAAPRQETVLAEVAATPTSGERTLEMKVGPLDNLEAADNLLDLFKEIAGLGTLELVGKKDGHETVRSFKLHTTADQSELLDLFSFHVDKDKVKFSPWVDFAVDSKQPSGEPAPVQVAAAEAVPDAGFGFFADAPGAPGTAVPAASAQVVSAGAGTGADHAGADASNGVVAVKPVAAKAADRSASVEASTIRVSVITQAMLAQNSRSVDPVLYQQLMSGLTDLDRNTRDLQEAVMSIRMIPMSTVFSRFPRMLRDLANKLGKKVELVTQGEATELDKGLVEKITDPLTHLVRNSCDHGIEMPADRLKNGKPEVGIITLAASHQGGSIVIEVRDNGKGLSREKLLKKARERGLDAPDSLTDNEVWNLIFEPGFSTADEVTDVSGRGVGMDVVRRNITSMGGTVDIESTEGVGMRVAVRLPLTLAIMDGMSVGVGNEVYILPLSSVVESFQVSTNKVKTVGGSGRLVEVRQEYMPVVDLERLFDVSRFEQNTKEGIMVVVESEAGRVALMVDELLGQQQVVVKNLESNYRKVNDVSGATIMGDGRVALILDVNTLVKRSRH